MSIRPTGHRVLVSPDEKPTESLGGLALPDNHDHVSVSGTIKAVSSGGSRLLYRARQEAIRDCCEVLESAIRNHGAVACLLLARDEMAGMLGSTPYEQDLAVGDRVIYPAHAGLTLHQDGQEYIMLDENDVTGVVLDEVTA